MIRLLVSLLFLTGSLFGQEMTRPESSPSACHVFIDYQFIWTLEMVEAGPDRVVPILNIVTFLEGQWDLRPRNIHIYDGRKREAEIERFAIDTGVPGDPYYLQYLKVQGDSFIGLDLQGDFAAFREPAQIMIDLGDSRFMLEPVDCLDFENIAHQINQVNFDSPDLRQDFEVLEIDLKGQRVARRRYY